MGPLYFASAIGNQQNALVEKLARHARGQRQLGINCIAGRAARRPANTYGVWRSLRDWNPQPTDLKHASLLQTLNFADKPKVRNPVAVEDPPAPIPLSV
jgi:hypothetical protein